MTRVLVAVGLMLILAGCSEPPPAVMDPCLALMRTAMKSMEPFTVIGHKFSLEHLSTETAVHIYIPVQTPSVFEAIDHWGAARPCWRQP